jgi:hypothetical protein
MWQEIAALTTVALTAVGLVARWLRRRKSGAGGCASCGERSRTARAPDYLVPTSSLGPMSPPSPAGRARGG